MHYNCKLSCDKCDELRIDQASAKFGQAQVIQGDQGADTDRMKALLEDMMMYMENEVYMEDIYDAVREDCLNRNELCIYWASIGECENNPGFMTLQCSPACATCRHIDVEYRCQYDVAQYPNAYSPGDLHAMFERVANGAFDDLKPVVHSAPFDYHEKRTNLTSFIDETNLKLDGPWIVTFDNFVTNEEADQLIQRGYDQGYERSKDVGQRKFDGTFDGFTNSGRTSHNAWCEKDCDTDPITQSIMSRIQRVTNIPNQNSEYLQILKYEVGEYYNMHHDYIDYQHSRMCGPRVLTFFLYLSDVEEGGGTMFNNLGIEVRPKKGRALLWPSVLDEDPERKDHRTDHEALPVVEGQKFAANAWLHLRDFKEANDKGCA